MTLDELIAALIDLRSKQPETGALTVIISNREGVFELGAPERVMDHLSNTGERIKDAVLLE